MNTLAWILQALLALMFLMSGFLKLSSPKEKLVEKMGWVEDFSSSTVKLIGLSELLGSLGLILPYAFNTLPVLTVVAAFSLSLIMVFAIPVHAKRKEKSMMTTNVVLLIMLLIVAGLRL